MTAEDRLLTDVELELMQILWASGRGTVRDVLAGLHQGRDLAYTSVSTVLRILEQKGFVRSTKRGRSHVYEPTITKPRYEARNVRTLVGRLFQGDPVSLVRTLVSSDVVSEDDLRELKELVDERLGQ